MENIYKTPLIVLIAVSFCCSSGIFLDLVTEQSTGVIGPIGMLVGIIIGMAILWKSSDTSPLEFLSQYFNPFSSKRREYSVGMAVDLSEGQTFHYCASALLASNLRYELYSDLGTILAIQPGRTFIFDNLVISLGVDLDVRVEPMETGQTVVAIGAKSRRGFWSLWMATMGERWLYESKTLTDTVATLLVTILDRQGVEHTDFKVLTNTQ